MKDIIVSQIDKISNGEGGALMEFLLALACKRLTLYPNHLEEVSLAVRRQGILGSHYQIIAKYLVRNTAIPE